MKRESDSLHKRFSVGLCLGEKIDDINLFLNKYDIWLSSIYFSVPLGRKFYSRAKLAEEYDGNEEKLVSVLKLIKSHDIKLELTLNTRDLVEADLDAAVSFCRQCGLEPEEIVCLKEYAAYLRTVCPYSEIKYSFNNHDTRMQNVNDNFDTIVIGKELLRDMNKINHLADKYNITYMLNNGCSFICRGNCGARNCKAVFGADIGKNGLNYVYARSSIFPSELENLLECNPKSKNFKFKISNRPWGLTFTQKALQAYISMKDPIDEIRKDNSLFKIFCATVPIAEHIKELDIDEIMIYKKKLGLWQ